MNHNCCGLCSIEIADLAVNSGRDSLIYDINLTLHCGELTALIGKNGAGKTTLLKAILGEHNYQGKIRFFNHEGGAVENPRIGYVPQHLDFDKSMPVTVLDFMAAAKGKSPVWFRHGKDRKRDILMSLAAVDSEYLLDRRLGALSGGELQRVLLALATEPMPDLLILDEPVSGVDVSGLDLFYKRVTELRDKYHMAILLVSHDLGLIQKYADKVILLEKTVVASGEVKDVFTSDAYRTAFGFLNLGEDKEWI
ncbi:metal ABC transporter ATP-binding protein [Anaerotignum sp.]|uniref:metal ABC transporter ATP-binding protein n=1 Tax=Anaerotignum sp. TaxID=2039241 RepID=UPI0028A5A6AB|nr:metal ABC transporter ATP-binding protein [Anaerotignum sp.]